MVGTTGQHATLLPGTLRTERGGARRPSGSTTPSRRRDVPVHAGAVKSGYEGYSTTCVNRYEGTSNTDDSSCGLSSVFQMSGMKFQRQVRQGLLHAGAASAVHRVDPGPDRDPGDSIFRVAGDE